MRKALVLFLLFPLQYCFAQPVLQVDPNIYKFEPVSEGTIVSHEFVITNSGNQELLIDRVISSCGCTVVEVSPKNVAPTQSAKVKVEFDTTGFSGYKTKSVRIYSNDPESSMTTLYLEGRVESELVVEPALLSFEKIQQAKVSLASQEVVVKVRDLDSDIKIKSVRSPSKRLIIKEIEADDQFRRLAVMLKPDLPIGEFRDRVLIRLDGASSKSLNIPVSVDIVGDLKLSPPVVSFGLLASNDRIHRKVIVENLSGREIKLQRATSEFEGLRVSHKSWNNGKEYILDLELDPSKLVGEQFKTQVILEFDAPEYSAVVLNVYGIRPPSIE